MTKRANRSLRSGFSLVEMLVVIAIIGMLAGLLVPVVMNAVTKAKQGAHKVEVDAIANAVEKYRDKYGDYPPDGSSWPIMERHLRKAFSQILQSELNLLDPSALASQGWNGNPWTLASGIIAGTRNDFDTNVVAPNYPVNEHKVMDPAEALVFFLGGFSSDPQRPFTGDGGPFITTGVAGQTLQYNTSRKNAFFEFPSSRLTVAPRPVPGNAMAYISTDETEYRGMAPDLLPVYLSNSQGVNRSAPIVYFDSRSYWLAIGPAASQPYVNYYQCAPVGATGLANGKEFGSIRPLVSDVARLPPNATFVTKPANFLFMEEKKFQVISPGIDGFFGGRLAADIASVDFANATWKFPSGDSFLANNGTYAVKSWILGPPQPPPSARSGPAYQQAFTQSKYTIDNCANFSAATFAQGQP